MDALRPVYAHITLHVATLPENVLRGKAQCTHHVNIPACTPGMCILRNNVCSTQLKGNDTRLYKLKHPGRRTTPSIRIAPFLSNIVCVQLVPNLKVIVSLRARTCRMYCICKCTYRGLSMYMKHAIPRCMSYCST